MVDTTDRGMADADLDRGVQRRKSIEWVEEDERGGRLLMMSNSCGSGSEDEVLLERADDNHMDRKDVVALCTKCGDFPHSLRR